MSDLLNQASLVMVPSGYKEDTVYSVVPSDGSGDLAFTRASNGTRVNSAGLVEVCPWNLAEYSEDFSNAIWYKSNGVITANDTTAPNGTTTADKFGANGTLTSSYFFTSQYVGTNAIVGQNYTITLYAKAGTITQMLMYLGAQNGIYWNLSNGQFIDYWNGVQNITSYNSESVGNGWYKYTISIIASNTTVQIESYSSKNGNIVANYTTADNYYLWGAQLNIGSTAKPYFPTTDRLNVPRLTYQNGGGGCPSLLLEKQSTNYAIYSEDLTQSATSLSGGTVGANVTTSPDGTQNADSFTVNTATSGHSGYYETNNAINGQPFTTSIFLKAGTGRYFLFRAMTDNYETRYGATIDLQSGTILSTNTAGSPTGTSSKIENFGNGWYRVSLTINAIGTQMSYVWGTSNTGTPSLDIYLDYSYTGNGTDSYYIWGMTLENSSYPTSYIPTTSSSATRVADACSKTGISSLIGQTSGSVFFDFEISNLSEAGNEKVLWYMKDGGTGERYVTLLNNGQLVYVEYTNTVIAQITKYGLTVGRHKCAIGYANNDMVFYVDGVQAGTDTAGTPNGFSTFGLQYYSSSAAGSQQVNQAVIFPTRLTNAELASLTTL